MIYIIYVCNEETSWGTECMKHHIEICQSDSTKKNTGTAGSNSTNAIMGPTSSSKLNTIPRWLLGVGAALLIALILTAMSRQRTVEIAGFVQQAMQSPGPSPSSTPDRMKCVIVTPAGRRQYLHILHIHLQRQKSDFAEWHLWLNTSVPEDIAYMHELARTNDWVKIITDPQSNPAEGSLNIHRFFKHATNANTVYIRLDDDVVYLEDGFIRKLYNARIKNPDYFLVYANIINNAVIAHKHQMSGTFAYRDLLEPGCMGNAWKDPAIAEELHRQFLKDAKANDVHRWHQSFADFAVTERVSINAIAFFGSVFSTLQVGADEEDWLSVAYLRDTGKKNLVTSSAICAHYAFHTQRAHLDGTDILQQYIDVANT
jgi:hypothetical protein